jgi:hypothetical protein
MRTVWNRVRIQSRVSVNKKVYFHVRQLFEELNTIVSFPVLISKSAITSSKNLGAKLPLIAHRVSYEATCVKVHRVHRFVQALVSAKWKWPTLSFRLKCCSLLSLTSEYKHARAVIIFLLRKAAIVLEWNFSVALRWFSQENGFVDFHARVRCGKYAFTENAHRTVLVRLVSYLHSSKKYDDVWCSVVDPEILGAPTTSLTCVLEVYDWNLNQIMWPDRIFVVFFSLSRRMAVECAYLL